MVHFNLSLSDSRSNLIFVILLLMLLLLFFYLGLLLDKAWILNFLERFLLRQTQTLERKQLGGTLKCTLRMTFYKSRCIYILQNFLQNFNIDFAH